MSKKKIPPWIVEDLTSKHIDLFINKLQVHEFTSTEKSSEERGRLAAILYAAGCGMKEIVTYNSGLLPLHFFCIVPLDQQGFEIYKTSKRELSAEDEKLASAIRNNVTDFVSEKGAKAIEWVEQPHVSWVLGRASAVIDGAIELSETKGAYAGMMIGFAGTYLGSTKNVSKDPDLVEGLACLEIALTLTSIATGLGAAYAYWRAMSVVLQGFASISTVKQCHAFSSRAINRLSSYAKGAAHVRLMDRENDTSSDHFETDGKRYVAMQGKKTTDVTHLEPLSENASDVRNNSENDQPADSRGTLTVDNDSTHTHATFEPAEKETQSKNTEKTPTIIMHLSSKLVKGRPKVTIKR